MLPGAMIDHPSPRWRKLRPPAAMPSLKLLRVIFLQATTCSMRMSTSSAGCSAMMESRKYIFAKASLVGANTVTGPAAARTLASPAASTAATSFDSAGTLAREAIAVGSVAVVVFVSVGVHAFRVLDVEVLELHAL